MTRRRHREDLVGVGFSAAAALAFGTVAIFVKLAYRAGAGPLSLLGVRFVIAAGGIAAFHWVTRRPLRVPRRDFVRLLLLGAFGYALESALFFVALDHAPAAVVMLIFYSYPLWTTVAAIAIGLDRLRPPVVVALAVSSGGIVLIFSLPHGGLAGPLYALGAALAVTFYFLLAQVFIRGVAPATAAMWTSVGAALSVSVSAIALGHAFPAGALAPAGALGIATAVAFVCMYEGIARIGSSRFAIAAMLEPVATIVLAVLFLGDPISARVALGAALVISALPILASTGRCDDAATAPEAV